MSDDLNDLIDRHAPAAPAVEMDTCYECDEPMLAYPGLPELGATPLPILPPPPGMIETATALGVSIASLALGDE